MEIVFLVAVAAVAWVLGFRLRALLGATWLVLALASATLWQGINSLPFVTILVAGSLWYAGYRRRLVLDFRHYQAEDRANVLLYQQRRAS